MQCPSSSKVHNALVGLTQPWKVIRMVEGKLYRLRFTGSGYLQSAALDCGNHSEEVYFKIRQDCLSSTICWLREENPYALLEYGVSNGELDIYFEGTGNVTAFLKRVATTKQPLPEIVVEELVLEDVKKDEGEDEDW